ncbi:MAG: hypothetical protein ACRDEA_01165 [Microcystaceae cyanobacterium]
MKKVILSLLTLTALGTISFPIQTNAGDSAVVQDATQTNYQTGDYNYSGQTSIQRNRAYHQGSSNGSTGDVMTSDQLSDQYGTHNRVEQRIRQDNTRSHHNNRCNADCDED